MKKRIVLAAAALAASVGLAAKGHSYMAEKTYEHLKTNKK